MFLGPSGEAGLLSESHMITLQSGEEIQRRVLLDSVRSGGIIIGEVNAEGHVALVALAPVSHLLEYTSGELFLRLDSNLRCLWHRIVVDFENTSQARAAHESVNEILYFLESLKLMSDKFLDW